MFFTWFLVSDDLLDHAWDYVSQLVGGANNTPAVPLITFLLIAAVLLDHMLDTGDTQMAPSQTNHIKRDKLFLLQYTTYYFIFDLLLNYHDFGVKLTPSNYLKSYAECSFSPLFTNNLNLNISLAVLSEIFS